MITYIIGKNSNHIYLHDLRNQPYRFHNFISNQPGQELVISEKRYQ